MSAWVEVVVPAAALITTLSSLCLTAVSALRKRGTPSLFDVDTTRLSDEQLIEHVAVLIRMGNTQAVLKIIERERQALAALQAIRATAKAQAPSPN